MNKDSKPSISIDFDGFWLGFFCLMALFIWLDYDRYAMGEQSELWGKRTVVCEVAK